MHCSCVYLYMCVVSVWLSHILPFIVGVSKIIVILLYVKDSRESLKWLIELDVYCYV
jgi:hypothetical protein